MIEGIFESDRKYYFNDIKDKLKPRGINPLNWLRDHKLLNKHGMGITDFRWTLWGYELNNALEEEVNGDNGDRKSNGSARQDRFARSK